MDRISRIQVQGWAMSIVVIALALAGCLPWQGKATEVTGTPVEAEPQILLTARPTLPVGRGDSPLPTPILRESASPLPTPKQANQEIEITVPPQAADAVAWSRADVAEQLGVTQDQVTVVSVQAVEWRDASLGCPKPGMMYAQVITPGYRIVLASGEDEFEYHSAQGQSKAIRCGPD